MSVLSITTLKQNIAAYKLLIQSGSITPDFEGKMLEDITDTLNALISASSTIAGFIDYNSAAPTPSVSSKYQFKSAGAAPSYLSSQTSNIKVGDGLFVVKNGAVYTYVWEDKGVNSVELGELRTEILGITDALNLAKQSKSDATLQTSDKTVSGAINETYARVTSTQLGTGNLILNPWVNVTSSSYYISDSVRSVNLLSGVKYKLTVSGKIGTSNTSRYLRTYVRNSDWGYGISLSINTKIVSSKSYIFEVPTDGSYSIESYCSPVTPLDSQSVTIFFYKIEVVGDSEPLPYQTTDAYGDLPTIANDVNIEEGEINYWHGQLVSRYSYDANGVKDGIYQFIFSSSSILIRKIVIATGGNTQGYPDFVVLANNDQITELSGDIDGLRQSIPTEWYVDANAAIASGKTSGANMPTWSTFTANTNAYTFALNDYIDLQTVEIPHGYKNGSAIQMHLHLATNGTNTTERKVKYQVFFTYVQPGTGTHQFVAEQNFVAELTIPANTPDKSAFILQMGIISDANMKFGNQVKMRIKRIAGTGTEPTGNPFLGQVGLHCLCNAVGTTIMQP